VDNEGISVLDNNDRADIQRIKDEIETLNAEYNASEDPNVDILNQIESLEDELDNYSDYIDVYHIIPSGQFYDTTEFEVIDSSVSNNKYAVGDDGEMQSSCYEYVEQLIDDIGYEGFNKGFANQYLDTDAIVSYAEDVWADLVRDEPGSYFEDSERMLSNEQEEKIEILKKRIENIERTIEHLEEQMDGENDDMIQEKIDELNEVSEEYSTEIEEIEGDPEGDFPEDLIEDKVDELVSDTKRDPEGFMEEFGLSWSDYVDKDEFIEGVIDADGYGATLNSYDGNADEIYVGDKLFYVMRID
jgi:cell division protein FtsB